MAVCPLLRIRQRDARITENEIFLTDIKMTWRTRGGHTPIVNVLATTFSPSSHFIYGDRRDDDVLASAAVDKEAIKTNLRPRVHRHVIVILARIEIISFSGTSRWRLQWTNGLRVLIFSLYVFQFRYVFYFNCIGTLFLLCIVQMNFNI